MQVNGRIASGVVPSRFLDHSDHKNPENEEKKKME
jgi:hypothetical protein